MSNKISIWAKIKNSISYLCIMLVAFFVIMYVFFRELLLRDWTGPWNCYLPGDKENNDNT